MFSNSRPMPRKSPNRARRWKVARSRRSVRMARNNRPPAMKKRPRPPGNIREEILREWRGADEPDDLNAGIHLAEKFVAAILRSAGAEDGLHEDQVRATWKELAGDFIGRHSYFLEDILHDRAKEGVIVFSLLAVLGFIGSFFSQRLKPFNRELGCLVLSLGLATSFVTPVKVVTAVQCPWSLTEFGGKETYSELLSPRPATDKPGRCWPGGHAATGFTLFALFFALRDRRPKLARRAFIFAFALGTVFSVSRMMQGAHFFSHNVWTAIFCWLICLGSYYWILYRPSSSLVHAEPVSA